MSKLKASVDELKSLTSDGNSLLSKRDREGMLLEELLAQVLEKLGFSVKYPDSVEMWKDLQGLVPDVFCQESDWEVKNLGSYKLPPYWVDKHVNSRFENTEADNSHLLISQVGGMSDDSLSRVEAAIHTVGFKVGESNIQQAFSILIVKLGKYFGLWHILQGVFTQNRIPDIFGVLSCFFSASTPLIGLAHPNTGLDPPLISTRTYSEHAGLYSSLFELFPERPGRQVEQSLHPIHF